MKYLPILSLLIMSCAPTTPRTIDRTLDFSCPIVEAYGPALLAELTKKPIERFEALAKVCEAAHDVTSSVVAASAPIPVSVAGAPAR